VLDDSMPDDRIGAETSAILVYGFMLALELNESGGGRLPDPPSPAPAST
jgi:hypothetical protein